MSGNNAQATFTGRHMLAIMFAFFGVIISVNLTMAYFARSSWTGLVVENSYVASQEFNTKMAETRAQAALGWTSTLTVTDGIVGYALVDRQGRAVPLEGVRVTFKRPVEDREDQTFELVRGADGAHVSRMPVADGVWLAEIAAEAGLEKPYRETLRFKVAGGKRL